MRYWKTTNSDNFVKYTVFIHELQLIEHWKSAQLKRLQISVTFTTRNISEVDSTKSKIMECIIDDSNEKLLF